MAKRFRRLVAGRDKVSAREWNRLVETVERLDRPLIRDGIVDSGGVFVRRSGGGRDLEIKFFEVQSNDTGDGVYNCHEHEVRNDQWDTTNGFPKLIEKDTTDVFVLNLLEYHVDPTYARQLVDGDMMVASKKKDNGGVERWLGTPIGPAIGVVMRARANENAPADTDLEVRLTDENGDATGDAFDVACEISGGGNLDDAIPRIAVNEFLFVVSISGNWYCTTVFQTSEDCACN